MDNVRLLLFMALAFLGMLLYQAWQEDYGVHSQQQASPAALVETPTAVTAAPVIIRSVRGHRVRPAATAFASFQL